MTHQARTSTLGQLLQQARDVQGLSLREAAARLHRADGQSITPKYLHLLEHDRRRPSLAFAHECATVLALDSVLVLTLAHLAEALLRRYLQTCPDAEMAFIEMLLKAEQRRFTTWKRVMRQIVAPESPPAPRHRTRARSTRTRRLHDAYRPRSTPKRPDH